MTRTSAVLWCVRLMDQIEAAENDLPTDGLSDDYSRQVRHLCDQLWHTLANHRPRLTCNKDDGPALAKKLAALIDDDPTPIKPTKKRTAPGAERVTTGKRQPNKGEDLVATWIGNARAADVSTYDLVTASGIRLEVKYSKATVAVRGKSSKRWTWNDTRGRIEPGVTAYDRLILVGEVDPRYRDSYADSTASEVIFDIPREDVRRLIPHSTLNLGTNPIPHMACPRRTELYRNFQVTRATLARRYAT